MEYEDILYDVDRGIARITINRPKVMNAFDGDTIAEMIDAFGEAGRDRSVGVIVLTGAGERAFCAGGDVNWEASGALAGNAAARLMENLYASMRATLKPIIARINGYSIGGGNHLGYFCDLSIAADHAIFGQNGPRVASPADGFIVGYSVRVLGAKRAREMWMLCRRYTAEQALNWGLVNAVVPMEQLDAEVEQWCQEILQMSPSAIKTLKAVFDDEFAPLRDRQGNRDYVTEINPGFWESGEQGEGAAAFTEKRAPDFNLWR
jgi:2-ketocyclohexanecarboxyl-CoA hydrolase